MLIVGLRFLLLRKARNKMALTKKIVEGKETYAGKAAMMKHEKTEPMKKEKKEEMTYMAKGGAVKKGAKTPAVAIVIGMGKPKAAGSKMMMNKGGMAKGKKC
jgi:hypothetical protein